MWIVKKDLCTRTPDAVLPTSASCSRRTMGTIHCANGGMSPDRLTARLSLGPDQKAVAKVAVHIIGPGAARDDVRPQATDLVLVCCYGSDPSRR